jgi:hypothetical protein
VVAGGLGEKSLRSIIEMAEKVADGSLPMDAEHLRRIAGQLLPVINQLLRVISQFCCVSSAADH